MPKETKRQCPIPETILGLSIFGGSENQPQAGIGWCLWRVRQPIEKQGEHLIINKPHVIPLKLTGAEYSTLRNDCGLSLKETAKFHDVRERTILNWDKTSPPPHAAGELANLRQQIEISANESLGLYHKLIAENPDISGVQIYKYHSGDYGVSMPAKEGLLHGAHNRIIIEVAYKLTAAQIPFEIIYAGEFSIPKDD